MFTLLLWVNLLPIVTSGPVSVLSVFDDYTKECKENWWTNLLYINNFYPTKGIVSIKLIFVSVCVIK